MLDHFEIYEIEVFVEIYVSPFHFANMSIEYIANLAANKVTDALRKDCVYFGLQDHGDIRERLIRHLEMNNQIGDSQHGFRNKRSCLTSLLDFSAPCHRHI